MSETAAVDPAHPPEVAASTEVRKRYRRRRSPRWLVGMRRVGYVATVFAWLYSIYLAMSQPSAGFWDQFGPAIVVTALCAVAYWVAAIVGNSSRAFFRNAASTLGAAATGSRRSKWERTTRQLSWIAAAVAIWFVRELIHETGSYSSKEVYAVMAIAAVGSFLVVRIVSWILRGFVRVK